MNNEDKIKDLASDVQESKKRMRQQIVTLVITLLVAICFVLTIFSYDADAQAVSRGVCTTYVVQSATKINTNSTLKWKITWRSDHSKRITFEPKERNIGETQTVDSVTGFSCTK